MARYGREQFEPHGSTQSPRMADLTVGDYANGMPNIRLGEMFKSFLRQLFWLIPLAIIGFLVAGWATKDLKRTYTGDGRIMVQLGEEYVYNPVGQTATGNGLTTTIDTITLTEAALMKNGTLIQQVIGEMTPDRSSQDRFDKKAFEKIRNAGNERARQDAVMELRKKVDESFAVLPRPKSSIIDVVYKHENPDVAVQTTNAFIDAYMSFRRQVFVEGSSELITERREATEAQLTSNERAIAWFLTKNDVSDFTSEQKGLQKRTEDLKASLNGTRASIAETEAALAEVEDQLRATPQTIDLYRDDRAAQRVSQAELELRQLMAKYLPTSDPVRQKRTELNELRALQNSYGGKASGGRRVGPNPTHQALVTRRNTLAASADSLREREFTQQRQLNSADGKIRKLTSLTPEYQNLLRERETLNERLKSYNAKEQEALVDAQQAEAQAENVKVISYAEYANKGRNMRKIMWALATLGWLIVLTFMALIRVFLDPKLYAVPGLAQLAAEDSYAMEPQPHPVVMPQADPAYDPIPEPIPAFDPGTPAVEPNPYEVQPAAYQPVDEYAQSGGVLGGYSTGSGYDRSAYVQYSQTGEAYAVPGSELQGTTAMGQTPAPMTHQHNQGQTDMMPTVGAYDANAALDLSHNPYLSGQTQAGSLGEGAQYDEYGRPLPPPVS